jgi:hypothetical protein
MAGIGIAKKGIGAVLKKFGKKKPKKVAYVKADPRYYLKQPKYKAKGLIEKESVKAISELGSGVNIQFRKSGKPFVPLSEGTKSGTKKALTKAKGWAKLGGPAVGAVIAQSDKKKK